MNNTLRNILRIFGIKISIKLSDFDKLSLDRIDGLPQEKKYHFKFVEDVDFICKNCQTGKMELILPEVFLGNLKLTECNNCKNREYKDFSFIN